MVVPTSEVGYTSATTERGDHEVHKRHVVAMEKKIKPTYTYGLGYQIGDTVLCEVRPKEQLTV
jgi:hypothetical protein